MSKGNIAGAGYVYRALCHRIRHGHRHRPLEEEARHRHPTGRLTGFSRERLEDEPDSQGFARRHPALGVMVKLLGGARYWIDASGTAPRARGLLAPLLAWSLYASCSPAVGPAAIWYTASTWMKQPPFALMGSPMEANFASTISFWTANSSPSLT